MSSARFRSRSAVLAVVGGLLLAGCGGDSADGPAPDAASGAAFPVTVTHAQGTVEIMSKPQRVVAMGFADIQIARALDAPIVGGRAGRVRGRRRQLPGRGPATEQ
ncbi:MAG: hypothetical protein ACRDST_22165 [Pseudonocardiaceae bacterium]